MKNLLLFFLLLPLTMYAQHSGPIAGNFELDCNRYVLQRLVAKDTMLGKLVPQLVHGKVKTLFVQKTAITDSLPHNIDGYDIRYVDLVTDAKEVYKALKDSTASLLYLSKAQTRYSYADIIIMPMYMEKKGRKIHAGYTGGGCKCTFFLNYATTTYSFDRSSCF